MLFNIILSTLASASFTAASCDPRTSTCQPIPAMPSSVKYNLSPSDTNDFSYVRPTGISSSGSDLLFTVKESGDNPTMVTNDYLLYGNVKATIKSAPGVGMVSAFILMSDVLDEIDYEWLGAYDNQVQTNYFYRGETANYDRGGVTTVTTPEETAHVYEIDWTETTLRWIVDGTTVRTLNKADTTAYGYPSTPCQIKIGVWASGDSSNSAGTIEWGGGPIDYTKGPYSMTLSSLEVTSYTTANSFSYTGQGTNVVISQDKVAASAASGTNSAAASSQTAGGVIADVKAATVSGTSSAAAAPTTTASTSTRNTGVASGIAVVAAGNSASTRAAAASSSTMTTMTTQHTTAPSSSASSGSRTGTLAAQTSGETSTGAAASRTMTQNASLLLMAVIVPVTVGLFL